MHLETKETDTRSLTHIHTYTDCHVWTHVYSGAHTMYILTSWMLVNIILQGAMSHLTAEERVHISILGPLYGVS